MEATRFSELRPRNVWDIVDDAFDLYRERFVLLCSISAVLYIPAYILYLLILSGPYSAYFRVLSGSNATPETTLGATFLLVGGMVLSTPILLTAQVIHGAATALVVSDTLSQERRISSLVEAYQPVLPRLGSLLVAAILFGLACGVAALLCFFPILYVTTVLAFLSQVILLENRNIAGAFKRSQDLAHPNFGAVFALTILLVIVTGILSWGIQGILSLVLELIPSPLKGSNREFQHAMIMQAFTSVVSVLLAPLSSIAATLMYYDLRVRREGLDILARAEETGYTLAPDPFGDLSTEEVRKQTDRMRTGRR